MPEEVRLGAELVGEVLNRIEAGRCRVAAAIVDGKGVELFAGRIGG